MMPSLKQNKAYWDARIKAEKAWQELAKKDMEKYNQHIVGMYNQTISDINQQIKADLALSEGKLVKADAMKEYESLAKRAVDKAKELRAKGKHVTRKDFSEDVNNRLKVYNATMRINRNEILKSKIGARLVELGVEQEQSLTNKLWNDYVREKERQAGILGITAKSNLWTSKEVQEQIAGQIAGANFSKRIWADIDGLKGQLDGLISSAVIRGESPIKTAKWLTGMVSASITNQEYAAERLARTETARIYFTAEQNSLMKYGYKLVKWIAEGNACKACREIATKSTEYGDDGVYPIREVPNIPVHPNCMCSISAYWVDESELKLDDSTVDKISISNIKEFTDAVGKLGITQVKSINKVDPKILTRIYETINDEFQKHPQLKGYLTVIKGGNRPKSADVAYVTSYVKYDSGNNENAKYRYYAELNLNKAKLSNINEINQLVKETVQEHWWSKKIDYTGLIKHEMAHALNSRANYAEIFGNDPIRLLNYNEAKKLIKVRKDNYFANDILLDTFEKLKVKPTKANFQKYISKYAGKNIEEAFAEAYSDESKAEFSRTFDKLLNDRLKKVFRQ